MCGTFPLLTPRTGNPTTKSPDPKTPCLFEQKKERTTPKKTRFCLSVEASKSLQKRREDTPKKKEIAARKKGLESQGKEKRQGFVSPLKHQNHCKREEKTRPKKEIAARKKKGLESQGKEKRLLVSRRDLSDLGKAALRLARWAGSASHARGKMPHPECSSLSAPLYQHNAKVGATKSSDISKLRRQEGLTKPKNRTNSTKAIQGGLRVITQ